LIAASLTLPAARDAFAQTSEIPPASVIDLEAATGRFVRLFDETCIQHRRSLEQLRVHAASGSWREMPGPFPSRSDEEKSTTLIAWGLWLGGVPYQVALIHFDDTAPALTCVVMSSAVDKSSLPDRMLELPRLTVQKRLKLGESNVTLFDTDGERDLRIACFTAIPVPLLIGQCGLVIVSDDAAGLSGRHRRYSDGSRARGS